MSEPYHWYKDKALLAGLWIIAVMSMVSWAIFDLAYKTPNYWNETPCSFPENVI